jgi:hypothetical protein
LIFEIVYHNSTPGNYKAPIFQGFKIFARISPYRHNIGGSILLDGAQQWKTQTTALGGAVSDFGIGAAVNPARVLHSMFVWG